MGKSICTLWHVASPGISLPSFAFLGEGGLVPKYTLLILDSGNDGTGVVFSILSGPSKHLQPYFFFHHNLYHKGSERNGALSLLQHWRRRRTCWGTTDITFYNFVIQQGRQYRKSVARPSLGKIYPWSGWLSPSLYTVVPVLNGEPALGLRQLSCSAFWAVIPCLSAWCPGADGQQLTGVDVLQDFHTTEASNSKLTQTCPNDRQRKNLIPPSCRCQGWIPYLKKKS